MAALAIPFLLIGIALRFTGDGQILFRQERVGRYGRTFKVVKFATVMKDAPELGAVGPVLVGDPRIPFLGRVLRASKLNELPQFVNVLLGDMSLVGWRPLMRSSFEGYSPKVRRGIVAVRPGVTGIGSVIFRDEESIMLQGRTLGRDFIEVYHSEILPYKGALELWYAKNVGLWTDTKVVVATLLVVVVPRWAGYRRWFAGLPDANLELTQSRHCLGAASRSR